MLPGIKGLWWQREGGQWGDGGVGERHPGVTEGFWWEVSRDGHGEGARGANGLGQETPRDFGGVMEGSPWGPGSPEGRGCLQAGSEVSGERGAAAKGRALLPGCLNVAEGR